MKSNLNLIICILISILIVNSCGEKLESGKTSDVQQHIKDWMFFDTGTWWVYKELNTGIIDSQYVTESKIFYYDIEFEDNDRPNYKMQSIEVHNSSGFYFHLAPPKGSSLIEKIRKSGSTYLRYNPLQVGERKASSGLGYTEIVGIDAHYTMDNMKYDTLITLLENYDSSEQNDSVEYKVLKGVGIINKKNITKNQNWKLTKYHIKMNKN